MPLDIVQVENLSFRYNRAEVLSDVTFSIQAGDYVGLAGPNGSGKTTLLKNILRLTPPTTGEISLFGTPIGEFHQWHKIGFLPQKTDAFHPHFPATVKEVVAMGMSGKSGKNRDVALQRALGRLEIAELKDRLIGELSGGQKQRVLLARSLVNEPSLLILDEPTTALDPETRDNFFALLESLNKHEGVTMILVTHDLGSIGRYASKFLYLDRRPLFYGSFDSFCQSEKMTSLFGPSSQHIICHRHGTQEEYGAD
ncbi:MAG: metal ABC transporter ATP-binding protein [Smithellaceae bacterium]|nr:metal ABC transporter ATP-binding protein [Smithellaceae bacterium]